MNQNEKCNSWPESTLKPETFGSPWTLSREQIRTYLRIYSHPFDGVGRYCIRGLGRIPRNLASTNIFEKKGHTFIPANWSLVICYWNSIQQVWPLRKKKLHAIKWNRNMETINEKIQKKIWLKQGTRHKHFLPTRTLSNSRLATDFSTTYSCSHPLFFRLFYLDKTTYRYRERKR